MTSRPVHRLSDLAQRRSNVGNELLTGLGQRDTSGRSVEQAHAELCLQSGDGMAQRRARHAELCRSSAEAAMARHGQHRIKFDQSRRPHCPDSCTRSCRIIHLIAPTAPPYLPVHPPFSGRKCHAPHRQYLIYIDGSFVTPHGTELFDLHNPATAQVIGRVRLADEEDARAAIAAAKRAFPAFARTSKAERIAFLLRMHAAMKARREELLEAIVEEYGAPVSRAGFMADHPANVLLDMARVLEDYQFTRRAGAAEVVMEPLGVAGLITPWNSDAGFICGKLAAAIAAGCTAVVKPSEMSAIQTQVVTEALHQAGLPAGVFNIVTGRGEVVGTEIASHPDVAKISFTGSTAVGKAILRAGAETMKRITLELGGKSPTIILDDADLARAIPLVLDAGFMNSGQACIAGTRILVPRSRLGEGEGVAEAGGGRGKDGGPRG